MNIFLARLSHETNGFSPGKTSLSNFRSRFGRDIFTLRGDGSCMGAVLDFGASHGWNILPSFDLAAPAGPVVTDDVVDLALSHLRRDLTAALEQGLDGICLLLHGAMTSETHDDVEGLLLAEIWKLAGDRDLPVAAMLDMHANVSHAMAVHANILVAYRKNPHTDAAATALKTAELLHFSIKNNLNLTTKLYQLPILWPPTGTGTADEPMSGLMEIADANQDADLLCISVCPGFAQADTPHTGLSVQIVLRSWEGVEKADAIAEKLFTYARGNVERGYPDEWDLDEAIDQALAGDDFPALIVEPADNIGGGTPGNATWVLEAFLRKGVVDSGLILAAPRVVEQLQSVRPGESAGVSLGGEFPDLTGPAVPLEVRVITHSDGEFDLEDIHSHLAAARGTRIRMGPSVLVESAGLHILLTTLATPPMDLGQWRCMGIHPEHFRLIAVKAAVAHRRAHDPIARRSFTVRTPGPCSSDLLSFPYKHLRRPMLPLDSLPPEPVQVAAHTPP
jgi:microcystin degradation protein MlrC